MTKSYGETLLTEANKIPEKASIEIFPEVTGRPKQGIGINITLDNQAEESYPSDDAGWRQVLDNLSWMSPAWLCLTLPVEKIVNGDGSVNKDADVLIQFDYFCRWAEEHEADIVLMFPKSVPAWLQFRGLPGGSPAPADLKAYAGIICNALDYFVHTLKYTRIRYITIFGEPFNADGEEFTFETPDGTDPYLYYVEMHKVVRDALDRNDLRSVELVGPNSADVYAYIETDRNMNERKADLSKYVGAIDLHSYRMRLDYLPPSRHIPTCTLTEYISDYLEPIVTSIKARKKPCFVTELGCMYYGKSRYGDNRGPSKYEAIIVEAELIIRGLNLGMDGFLKWVYMFNTQELRGHYHLLSQVGDGYQAKHNLYGYGVMCRYFPKQAKVLKTITRNADNLWATALESVDGDITLLMVNDHPSNLIEAEITSAPEDKIFHQIVFDNWETGKTARAQKNENGKLSVIVPPLSITAVTSML